MNQVGYQETSAAAGSSSGAGENNGQQRLSIQGSDAFSSIHATGKSLLNEDSIFLQ